MLLMPFYLEINREIHTLTKVTNHVPPLNFREVMKFQDLSIYWPVKLYNMHPCGWE